MDSKKKKIILIVVGAVVVALLIGLTVFSGGGSEPEEPKDKTPVKVDLEDSVIPAPGAIDDTDPDIEGEGSSEETGSSEDGHDQSDGHDHGTFDCTLDAHGCDEVVEDDGVPNVEISDADYTAAALVEAKAVAFARVWAQVDSAEDPNARAARLIGAGATEQVAAQVSMLARKDTKVIGGVEAKVTPQQQVQTFFLGRHDGLLRFEISMNLDAAYKMASESASHHIAGGFIEMYVNDQGVVHKVVEHFPTIKDLH